MSYTLNIEPEIIRDAEVYAKGNGTTLEQFVRACVLVAATQKDMADTGRGDVALLFVRFTVRNRV